MTRVAKIFAGVLHSDRKSSLYITIRYNLWALECANYTDPKSSPEILCQHEDFDKFVELVAEYSDYVEGDS